jgi:adenine-specific DNA methylase
MIDYSDSSDLFYVWAKRAMHTADPLLSMTMHPGGVQEKTDDITVKRGGSQGGDHRTQTHYDESIARAFAEARRVVTEDGVVTIVFGHGDLEVWRRLLSAISAAGLVLTGSWPAKTEAGGASSTAANIVTTLTMACRPAPGNRCEGRLAAVESQVKAEVKERVELWDRSGLAHTDMLMASAGPAMEVTGRYSRVLDVTGDVVDLERFLIVARKAVQEAADIKVVSLPLDSFDARTRFALWWVRLYSRQLAPKSELRWQVLAGDLEMADVKNLLHLGEKGCRFLTSKEFKGTVTPDSSVIDVAMAMAKAWPDGLDAVAEVLVAAARDNDDEYLWSAINYLATRLPEGEADVAAWNGLQRSRRGVDVAARNIAGSQIRASRGTAGKEAHPTLF